MITFDTVDGPVSGFVRSSELREENSHWYVRAVIQAIRDDDRPLARLGGVIGMGTIWGVGRFVVTFLGHFE
jgi:hypothetical protein